jgi:hypothetical protein
MAVMFAAIAERGFLFKQLHQTFVIQFSTKICRTCKKATCTNGQYFFYAVPDC